MSQSFSAFVMCFCLLSVNLIILVYLGFWFCFLVVLLSYSWFGRQVWVFNYFFLTSWNFMASPRLHHFSIACSSFNDCFLLYLEPLCFQFLSFLDTLVAFDPGCFQCCISGHCRQNLYLACYMHHLVDFIWSKLSFIDH